MLKSSAAKYIPYIKNSGYYFISSFFVAIVSLLINPLLAANLSPEDYAILGYYSSFNLLLVPLLHFSIMSYYARQYYFTPEERRDELGDTILLSMIIIGFISCLLFIGIFYVIYKNTNNSFPFSPFASLTFLQVYIGNIVSFYLIKLRIQRKAKEFSFFSIMQCLFLQGGVILLVVCYKFGAEGKLYATFIVTAIAAVYSFYCSLIKWRINRQILKDALKFGLPLTVSALFWYGLTGIDRAFLEQLSDIRMLGIYNVGLQIASYMGIFYTTIANTFDPDIYQSIALKNNKKLIIIIVCILLTVTGANLFFVFFAPQLIGLLTANRYIESSTFAQIFAFHNIAMACYYMVVKLLVGYRYVKQELVVRVIGASISIAMFKILIDKWQFYGAAWGQVASFVLLTFIGISVLLIQKRRERRLL